jgi:hypothetical protein
VALAARQRPTALGRRIRLACHLADYDLRPESAKEATCPRFSGLLLARANQNRWRRFEAIAIDFRNETKSVVYLTDVRISNCTPLFPVPAEADRDRFSNSYQLKFLREAVVTVGIVPFDEIGITLQTGEQRRTAMPVTNELSQAFFAFSPLRIRQFFRCPK